MVVVAAVTGDGEDDCDDTGMDDDRGQNMQAV